MYHSCFDQMLSKFTAGLYQLQIASRRLLLESSQAQFQTFTTNAHAPNYPLSVGFHSLSYFTYDRFII